MRIEESDERAPVGREKPESVVSSPKRVLGSILSQYLMSEICSATETRLTKRVDTSKTAFSEQGRRRRLKLTNCISNMYTDATPWFGFAVAKNTQIDAIDTCEWYTLDDRCRYCGEEEEDKGDK